MSAGGYPESVKGPAVLAEAWSTRPSRRRGSERAARKRPPTVRIVRSAIRRMDIRIPLERRNRALVGPTRGVGPVEDGIRRWLEGNEKEVGGIGCGFDAHLACRTHPSCSTPSVPESRSAAGGSVFWLPDQPMLRAFPVLLGPVALCADRPRLQRRARAGFSPASRRSKAWPPWPRPVLALWSSVIRLRSRRDSLHRRWSTAE
jgi:hypothetical protein